MEDALTHFLYDHFTTLPSRKVALLADSALAVHRSTLYVRCLVLSILIFTLLIDGVWRSTPVDHVVRGGALIRATLGGAKCCIIF